MLTLHQATDETKATLKWGGIIVGIILFIFIAFRVGVFIKEIVAPTPPPPPTVSFGKITVPIFPSPPTKQSYTYRIDTLTGLLPTLPDRINVYKIIQPQSSLLALKRAQDLVATVGFSGNFISITDTKYQWQSTTIDQLPKTLTYDIFTSDFTLASPYRTNPSLLPSTYTLPTEKDAITTAKNFLAQIAPNIEDIDPEKTKTTLLTIQGDQLVGATSLSTANMIKVDFYQKDLDEIPVYYPYPPSSTMTVFIGPSAFGGQVVEAKYTHQPIDSDNTWATEEDHLAKKVPATYPLISAQEAYTRLQKGEGYIAAYYGQDTAIAIKKVSLGYYLSDTLQGYTFPIIVFEGNEGFVAYVPAVADTQLLTNPLP